MRKSRLPLAVGQAVKVVKNCCGHGIEIGEYVKIVGGSPGLWYLPGGWICCDKDIAAIKPKVIKDKSKRISKNKKTIINASTIKRSDIKMEQKAHESENRTIIKSALSEMKVIGLEKEQDILKLAVENNYPVMLIGETGVGKTYIVNHVARMMGKRSVRVSLNGEIGINELVGKWLVKDGSTFWQDGILVECMRKGWWVILDEINAALPEVLFCLNSLLDDSRSLVLTEKDGEIVTPHPDFRVFATLNPPEEYAGTKELNKALLSRFQVVLCMEYYTPAVELEILRYQTGIEDSIGRIIIDVGNCLRKLKQDRKTWYTCSTRDLVNWARLLCSNGHSLEDTFIYSILNKCSEEEKPVIVKEVKNACKVQFNWASSASLVNKALTEDLAIDIKKLEDKRQTLSASCDKLKSEVASMKQEIEK